MSTAILVGDVHLTDESRKPTNRAPGYTAQILDKIRFVAAEAQNRACPLVFAGDLFHLKASSKNSHQLVQDFHKALSGVRTFIVPGNHDMAHDRLDSLDKQPLGALARMENVSLLLGQHSELPGISGIPYLSQFDGGLWQDAAESWNYAIGEPELLVTHAPLFPPGQAPGVYASIDPDAWAEFFIGVPATYYGHIHDSHSTYMSANGLMQFCNQGALSRGSLHESSVNRKPAVTYWDGQNFERIEVPHLPKSEVFVFEKAAAVKDNKASAEAFAEAVGSTVLPQLTLEEVRAELQGKASSKQVMDIIEDVLEGVR